MNNTVINENKTKGVLICSNCGGVLDPSHNFCTHCGAKFNAILRNIDVDSPEAINANTSGDVYLSYDNFDALYKYPIDVSLNNIILRESIKAGIDMSSKHLLPSKLVKRKLVLNIIFSILLFLYFSLIFFHFPVIIYFIGGIILILFFLLTRKFDYTKYLNKEVKSRPAEKIANVIMNIKNTIILDYSKKILIFGSLIALILPCIIFYKPRIWYESTDGGYAVRFYIYGLSNQKTVVIPETYKGKNVVLLRGNTFSNMPLLEKVELPDTITEIRGQAFMNCSKLKEVNIPKNLEYLGGGAFYGASSITNIELPDTLTFLGGESFYGATNLVSIKLSESLTEIRGDTFGYCTSLKSITIPDGVTRIGGHAFYGDYSLSEVNISKDSQLEEIGSSAFRECDNLETIYVPSRTSISDRAFKGSPTFVYRYSTNGKSETYADFHKYS